MSYLALHIDVEFIVGVVCADNGTSFPIINGKEELLWLYFFNNPHQNTISYGKDNKTHFNNSEVNYYGKFFEKIEREQDTFLLRSIEHPVIDLLKESGLLETLKKAYKQKTLDSIESVPTLITFSSSISDNAKQKTVEYLKKNGFQIDSYTIPLAELTCYQALNQKGLKARNGDIAIFLEATNATLHLMKLSLLDNYFLKDVKTVSNRGKGLDPRKRALVRFVVNEVNKATGVLSTEDEKEDEIERWENSADEWLKLLDAQNRNMPLRIPSVSFAKAPSMKRDVMVRKDDLESDTGQYTQDLKDIFEAFRNDNVKSEIAAIFLLGNCFQSDRVKSAFEQMLGKERLYFYTNKDIADILTMYPKIDITRYASEEQRIKAQAEADRKKLEAQRKLEEEQKKAEETELLWQAAVQKAEEDRIEAKRLFERAVEFDKEGKLQEATDCLEAALRLLPDNAEFKQLSNSLNKKTSELKIKTEQYKSLLIKAEKSLKQNDLESALNTFILAKSIFDSAEIRNSILEVENKIEKRKKQEAEQKQKEEKINQLLNAAEKMLKNKLLTEAETEYNKVLAIDASNSLAKEKLAEIALRKSAPPPPPPPSSKPKQKNEVPLQAATKKTPPPPPPVKTSNDNKQSEKAIIGKKILPPPPPSGTQKKASTSFAPPPPPPPTLKKK